MKKIILTCMVLCIVMAFGATNSFAGPSSKASCSAGDLSTVEFNSASPIFEQAIHTAAQKDLFIDVSLECGLTTNTKVMSKALQRAISEAEAYVKVWVAVDGLVAEPGEVTFAKRYQGLIAEFAGSFSTTNEEWQSCFVKDPITGITTIDPDCLTEEMLALILDTMTANSFNFVYADLPAGDHTVVVWADVDYHQTGDQFTDSEDLSSWAPENISTRAYLGKGSVTIESVRLVKDAPVSLD